jgi:5'-deoxynucleotidase YfbR-like HD superfamily hydrolase
MTLTEIRNNIMTDDAFVLEEVRKLQYLHQLKTIIRSNLKRTEDVQTESVAEHIYTMLILADYFSRIEEFETPLSMQRVYELITWHDIDEIETGDVVGYHKTAADRAKEHEAQQKVIMTAPVAMRHTITEALLAYKNQDTPEAQFVKAIDKIDPVFMILNENGRKICDITPMNEDQHTRIKIPYLKNYPYMMRFFVVTRDELRKGGFFVPNTVEK